MYTVARAGLLLACLALGRLSGLAGPFLLIVALLVSGVVSWFVLRRQRIAMGGEVERRVSRIRGRIDQRAAAEDAYVDALHGASEERAH
jgi:CHASE1-domain containing sensor protein